MSQFDPPARLTSGERRRAQAPQNVHQEERAQVVQRHLLHAGARIRILRGSKYATGRVYHLVIDPL